MAQTIKAAQKPTSAQPNEVVTLSRDVRATSLIRPAAAALSSVPSARSVPFAAARAVGLSKEASAVLHAAAELEPDLEAAVAWYLLVPIAEFGQLTAGELVAQGRAEAVLAFLRDVIEGRRG